MRRFLLLLICLAGFMLVPRMAFALNCSFTPKGEMVFSGSPSGPAFLDASLDVNYNCTGEFPFPLGTVVLVCPEMAAFAATKHLSMTSGVNTLDFNVYSDPARTKVAGTATQATPITFSFPFMGVAQGNITMFYGRIPKQRVEAGDYSKETNVGFSYRWLQLFETASCQNSDRPLATLTFTAKIKVDKTCSVSATPIDFGRMPDLPQTLHIDLASTLRVNCTPNVAYNILLNGGSAGAGPGGRRMFTGAGITGPSISYGLYSNPDRTDIWGDLTTTGGKEKRNGTGADQAYAVYARVPRGQVTPTAGVYSDSVIVTVSY
jgi:spore coat protein U-like protein